MSKKFDVYGIGNAIVDFQVQITEDELSSVDVEKSTMALTDKDSQHQILSSFSEKSVNKASGGSAANTMIALNQLGARTAYSCLVGDDENGIFYLSEMKEIGISIQTKPKPSETTGSCLIFITPDAERTMLTHLGVSANFSEVDVSEEAIKNSNWIYIEGYLFSSENGRAASKKAIDLAKKHGTKVSLTFSDVFIVNSNQEFLEDVVGKSDLIFANFNEARAFLNTEESLDKVVNFMEQKIDNFVITLSEKGVFCKLNAETARIEAYPTTAIDDTGAGDMFAGAFLHSVNQGLDLQAAGQLSCLLSSKVVSKLGPRLEGDLKNIDGVSSFLEV